MIPPTVTDAEAARLARQAEDDLKDIEAAGISNESIKHAVRQFEGLSQSSSSSNGSSNSSQSDSQVDSEGSGHKTEWQFALTKETKEPPKRNRTHTTHHARPMLAACHLRGI